MKITIYNSLGQQVRTLADEFKAAGSYRVIWDGLNDAGAPVSSGTYIYQFDTPDFTQTNKMTLLR